MKTTVLSALAAAAVLGSMACSSPPHHSNSQTNTSQSSHNSAPTVDHSKMDHSKMDHSAMKSSPNAASAPYDLQFLDTMIAHHQGAVDMAQPVAARAGHDEIKKLGAAIIVDQQREIDQMKAWREKWFAGAAPAMNMEMAGMADSMKGMDMSRLNLLSGNEFDLEFIRQMIPHHEGAVVMAKEALQKSQKEEIKTLAGSIIKAQEAEIAEMKKWQTAWAADKK